MPSLSRPVSPLTRAITTVLLAAAGAVGLASCQLATPFSGPGYQRGRGAVEPGVGPTVVVAVTNAVIDGSRRRVFIDYTRRVARSLPTQDGYLGHSLRTRPLGNEAWTMTIWRDHASLDGFAASPEHLAAIREGIIAVKSARFLRFEWPSTAEPPRWEEVLTRLEAVAPTDYAAARASRN